VTARDVLDGMKARLSAATPWPWLVNDREQTVRVEHSEGGMWLGEIMFDRSSEDYTDWMETFRPDATFIAAAPTDVARLTAALEAVLAVGEYNFLDDQYAVGYNDALEDVRAAIENALEGE
jgi:hypothetical protein